MAPDRFRRGTSAFSGFVLQRHIVDQPARFADLVHHIVAGVDAPRTGDAFQLLPVADVDAHRADVHAGHAVDAIALGGGTGNRLGLAARLAPPVAIGDGQRVLVHHRGLNARPWTGIDADLFAGKAAEQEGRRRHRRDGDIGHRMRLPGQQIAKERRGVGEIEHPGAAGQRGDHEPDRPFHQTQPGLARAPRLVPQPDAGVAVALDPAFGQDEEIGPDRLRAGIAAPDPAQRRGEEEQPQARHDQKTGDEVEFMRPDLDPEEKEAPVRQIDQHRLIGQAGTTIPADPRQQVIDPQRHRHDDPFQIAEPAFDPARKDRLAGLIKLGRVDPDFGHGWLLFR